MTIRTFVVGAVAGGIPIFAVGKSDSLNVATGVKTGAFGQT